MKVKYLKVKYRYHVCNLPSFHKTGSVAGMKKQFYGEKALLVRCGNYIYDVSRRPEIYRHLAK